MFKDRKVEEFVTYFVGRVKEFIQSSEKICKDERRASDLITGQIIRIVPIVWPE